MNDDVLNKIRRILARADESRNDNEHEREIAMRQAHALLAKHGLSMGDVSASEKKDTLGALGRSNVKVGRTVWRSGVYVAIAKLNGCTTVRSYAGTADAILWIIGRAIHVEVTKQMGSYLINSITNEAKRNGYKLTEFGNGAWYGISDQVKSILDNMKRGVLDGEQLEAGTALMVVDQHKQALVEAEDTRDTFFPNLTKGRKHSSRVTSSFAAGKKYGSSVGLNRQVGSGGAKRIGRG